jgi:CheY-like chemotaxis protein
VNLLILVVDDEPDVEVLFRQQFRRDLRAGRFTVEFAQSAPMALQRITDAGDRSLILILSDINMPGMSGLELLPKARAARPDVPIIMITAYGDAETKRKALEGGAEALVSGRGGANSRGHGWPSPPRTTRTARSQSATLYALDKRVLRRTCNGAHSSPFLAARQRRGR